MTILSDPITAGSKAIKAFFIRIKLLPQIILKPKRVIHAIESIAPFGFIGDGIIKDFNKFR